MRLLLVTLLVGTALTGCALRPRYRDFTSNATVGQGVELQLTNAATGQPLGGVKLELSEWKNRLSLTTDAEGRLTLPVEKKYLDENPVLVVSLPAGVPRYTLAPAPPKPPAQTEPAPVVPENTALPAPAPSPGPSAPNNP